MKISMKHLSGPISLVWMMLIVPYAYGQTPDGFHYQAVVRDGSGAIKANTNVMVGISILQGSPSGAAVYSETHDTTTSELGLVNLIIGRGTSKDDFSSIDWSAGPYFLKVLIDDTEIGTTQLLSVPYAKFAEKAGSMELHQTSQNYYGTGYTFISKTDTAYKSITGLNPTITVPENCTVLITSTGFVYGTSWNSFSAIKVGLFVDGVVNPMGGEQCLYIVDDDNFSAGGANWTIVYPVQLSPGSHQLELKAKSIEINAESSVTIDNGGNYGHSMINVTYLKN